MKLPPLPAPYYWSNLDNDVNIVRGTKDVPRDRLIDEIRVERNYGHIVGYVCSTWVHARTDDNCLYRVAEAETKEEAIQLMYNLFLLGELKGGSMT